MKIFKNIVLLLLLIFSFLFFFSCNGPLSDENVAKASGVVMNGIFTGVSDVQSRNEKASFSGSYEVTGSLGGTVSIDFDASWPSDSDNSGNYTYVFSMNFNNFVVEYTDDGGSTSNYTLDGMIYVNSNISASSSGDSVEFNFYVWGEVSVVGDSLDYTYNFDVLNTISFTVDNSLHANITVSGTVNGISVDAQSEYVFTFN